jgi:hypothetical protein
MKTTISTKAILSIIVLIFSMIAGRPLLCAQVAANTPSNEAKAGNDKLNSDLLKAISKGDVKKINALAQAGAEINRPGTAVDIGDVQADGGWFRYRFKSADLVGAPVPMEQAILSGRPESVRALLALGADVKTEFFEDARCSIPFTIDCATLAGASRRGTTISINGPGGAAILYVGTDGVVNSRVRPTPANQATFLSIVERWLAMPRAAKERQRLDQIADMLRQAMQK